MILVSVGVLETAPSAVVVGGKAARAKESIAALPPFALRRAPKLDQFARGRAASIEVAAAALVAALLTLADSESLSACACPEFAFAISPFAFAISPFAFAMSPFPSTFWWRQR